MRHRAAWRSFEGPPGDAAVSGCNVIQRLFKLPLEQLGPRQSDFTTFSHIHGPAHACRVQALTVVLCRRMGFTDELPAAFCAGFLHDLSRRDDGLCSEHGRWAVEEKLELHAPFFARLGVDARGLDQIRSAVANHSVWEDLPREHPHWRVAALLKDADALDRWRIGQGPSPQFLRLPATFGLVAKAREFFELAGRLASFDRVWDATRQLFAEELADRD
jgi:hypothetical protein